MKCGPKQSNPTTMKWVDTSGWICASLRRLSCCTLRWNIVEMNRRWNIAIGADAYMYPSSVMEATFIKLTTTLTVSLWIITCLWDRQLISARATDWQWLKLNYTSIAGWQCIRLQMRLLKFLFRHGKVAVSGSNSAWLRHHLNIFPPPVVS